LKLAGKTVVVVGGGSGIGLAVAEAAYGAGASLVAIAGRSPEKLESAKAGIGGGARAFPVDVSDEGSVRALFKKFDRLDHLVVTAAETMASDISGSDAEGLRPTLDTRVWGGYFAAKHAAPRMGDGASMTFVSGMSSRRPYVGSSVISASCGAIEAMSRALALELAPIRVNTIRPGIVETPLLDGFYGEGREEFLENLATRLPVGRVGRPEDIADAAMFLMGNGFVSGSVLQIDGGASLV
jgi:NAD(P)-dependent dehydrogenase (short-subunit alcohol dehydrogenase family)